MRPSLVAIVVALAAGCQHETSIRLDIVVAPSLTVEGLVIAVEDRRHDHEVTDSLVLLVPEGWSGSPRRIEVEGMRGDVPVARASTVVIPVSGREVFARVTLVDAACPDICDVGALDCRGDAVVACVLGADGCPAWGEAAACISPTPFCSGGACSATCTDDCVAGATMCQGTDVRTCGQADGDTCLDWGPATACAGGMTCEGDGCTMVARDGVDEIVLDTSATYVFPSTGSAFGPEVSWSDWGHEGGATTGWLMKFADVDGDGRGDQIFLDTDETLVRRSTGTSFAPAESWSAAGHGGSANAGLLTYYADVTGDGKADQIYLVQAATVVRPSTGTSFGAPQSWSTYGHGGSSNAGMLTYFADVDGDAKADLIYLRSSATFVRRSTGSAFGAESSWSDWGHQGSSNPGLYTYFADVDGDRKADQLYLSSATTIVRRSSGAAFGAEATWSDWGHQGSTNTGMQTYVADANGDGKADEIYLGSSTTIVRLSSGTGFGAEQAWSDWGHGGSGTTGMVTYFVDVTD